MVSCIVCTKVAFIFLSMEASISSLIVSVGYLCKQYNKKDLLTYNSKLYYL